MPEYNKEGRSYDNNLRRIFHFLSISFLALAYGLSDKSWEEVLPPLSLVSSIIIGVDVIRLQYKWLNHQVQRFFSFILRKHENYTISGSSWFLLGAIISLTLFPKEICVFGFLCLAVGDPLASYVGIASTNGQKLGQKTWAGCVGFFLASWMVGSLWLLHTHTPLVAFTAAACGGLAAAITERLLLQIDDNLAIPLIGSGVATAWIYLF